jgi:DNA polymerase III delta prime subunit
MGNLQGRGFLMKKNQLRRGFLLSIMLMLSLNSLGFLYGSQPHSAVAPQKPLEVIIKEQPASALSEAAAEFLQFITGGIKSTWTRYFALQDKEAILAGGSGTDKFKAVQSAALRGVLLATPALVGIILMEGTKVGLEMIKRDLLSENFLILNKKQKPFYGTMSRIKRWWSGSSIQRMVFNTQVRSRLQEIEKKTIALRDLIQSGKNRTYANLLLYGESGTGKTLFAQQLAIKTNMNFLPITAASILQKGVEGIKYFDELIEIANRSCYGTIIFIDEADGLFINRNTIVAGSDHYIVLEHILSIIDGRSDKFMIIAATNHAYLLDPAMGRRFQDRVLMPLPDASTRKKLLTIYMQQILFNVSQTSIEFVRAAQTLMTLQMIDSIVTLVDGLSHAEIADMITEMRNKAELNKRFLSVTDIENAIDEAVEKHRKNEEDKKLFAQVHKVNEI